MSPLMRSFPDMNAIVGFSFPKTQSARMLLWRPGYCHVGAAATELTGKHLAEVAGVHLHDDVSLDRRLTRAHAARATLQVKKPDSCVFPLRTQRHLQDKYTVHVHRFRKQF